MVSNVSAFPVRHADYCENLGWYLVPIPARSKGPTHQRWQQPERALSDGDTAQQFFDKNPTLNVGLLHGASGTCAIDIDNVEFTKLIFSEMGIDFDELMQSAPQIVGRENRGKLLFNAPPDLVTHKISWPVEGDPRKTEVVFELRAGATQDVLPPSIHPDTGRPYRWEGRSIWDGLPDLPQQLVTIWKQWDLFRPQMMGICPWLKKPEFVQPPSKPRAKSDGPSVIDAFNEAHDIRSLLVQFGYKQTGKNRFLSPNSSTKLAGCIVFDDGRAFSHHASDPFDERHSFDAFDLWCQYEHQGDFKQAVKEAAGLLKLDTRSSNISDFKAEPKATTPLFKRIGLDDVVPPVWLVKSHIEEGTFAMVFGPSGAKKSFLVYDLACCIATGKDWHGNRVKQGAVLIICGEGHGGLNRRLKGWEKFNQQSLKDVPLYGNERPLTLTDDADIEALISYIEDRISIDGTPNLIVVDTLARALGAADEKSGADINKLIVSLTAVIQQYKCAVLLVHHTGHSEAAQHRARGASELPAAVDHEFRVEPYDEAGVITGTLFTSTKMKDASLGEPVVFDMITVGLGVCDEDMVEIDTLVPELRGPASQEPDNTINPMALVEDEDRKLRRKGEVKRADLVTEVYIASNKTKRTAQKWVKEAIEAGRIDDFPRS